MPRLQNQIKDEFASLEKRFEAKAAQQDAENAEVKSAADSHYRHFEGRCDTADKNAAANFGSLSANIAKSHQHFSDEVERIYSSSAAADAAHDGKFEKLEGALAALTATFEERIGNTDRQSAAKAVALGERMDRVQQHFSDVFTTMDQRAADKNDAQDAAHAALATTVSGNHLALSEAAELLEKRVNEDTHTLTH